MSQRTFPKSTKLSCALDPNKVLQANMTTLPEKEGSFREVEGTKGPADPTLQIYVEFASKDLQWKAIQNKKLLRKVDIRLHPFLILMYLLNFLDRSNLAQARLGSLEADLGMTGTDFNLATSILFVVCRLLAVLIRSSLTMVRDI